MNRQRGEVRFASIVWLLLFVAAGLICYEAIPVKMRSSQFQDFMTETAKFSSHLTDERLKSKIINRGQTLELPVDKDTVEVKKRNGRIFIHAEYTIPLVFPFYTYNWKFEHVVDRPIFII